MELESIPEMWESSDLVNNGFSVVRYLIQLLLICFLIGKRRELNEVISHASVLSMVLRVTVPRRTVIAQRADDSKCDIS